MITACEACGSSKPRSLARDHCHDHNQPRGEICPRCNNLLAYIDRGALGGVGPSPKPITLIEILKLNEYRDRCPDCVQAA